MTERAASEEIEHGVARYYAGRLEEHGPTHWGVDWNSTESQDLRFDRLLEVVDASRPYSLLDYGCGYGALAEHLADTGHDVTYVGYDVADEMVQAARELYPDARFTSDESQLGQVDYCVASGVFNVRLDCSDDAWIEYVQRTLRRLAQLTRYGFSFNMLTSYSDAHLMRDYLYYADPGAMFDFCKRELSRHVALLHDYGLWEFTVVVRHDEGLAT